MKHYYKTIAELAQELKDDRFLKSIEKAIETTKEFARATGMIAQRAITGDFEPRNRP